MTGTGLRLIERGSEAVEGGMTNIEKMQLAIQIAALIQASFKQPNDLDVRDILAMASNQLSLPDAPRG